MAEVVYSTRKHPFAKGRTYQNPSMFAGVVDGAKKVFIEGDWPVVEKAYAKAGVKIVKLEGNEIAKAQPEKKGPDIAGALAERGVPADPKKAGDKA